MKLQQKHNIELPVKSWLAENIIFKQQLSEIEICILLSIVEKSNKKTRRLTTL